MTASYPLLISGALLISLAVLCNGDPVVDADGDEIQLSQPDIFSFSRYTIRNAAVGFHGGLAPLQKSSCTNYIYEAPETDPGMPVSIDSSSTSQQPVMQLGNRYKFSFWIPRVLLCDTAWSIGPSETNGDISFLPITAGDFFYLHNFSWFEARSTEEKGVYKLAACSSELDANACPEIGTFVVNGKTVLGIGGEHFTVRFHKYEPTSSQ